MFSVGEQVVHPLYGAGIVRTIESKKIDNQSLNFYTIHIPTTKLEVMISTQKAEEIGVRKLVTAIQIEEVFEVLSSQKTTMSSNWNERYKQNIEKIKTGDLKNVAEVVKNLFFREKEKGLSGNEKKLFTNAKQILISELSIVKGLKKDETEEMVTGILRKNLIIA